MTSKPEGPGKEPGSSGSQPQKRPHATIDLKATEVKGERSDANAKSDVKPPVGSAPASASKPVDDKKAPLGAQHAKSPPPRSGGAGRTFAYLLASLAGGLVALTGAELLHNGAILSPEDSPSVAANLEARLATLEKVRSTPAEGSDLRPGLEAATKRLAELEKLAGNFEQMQSEQARLAEQAKQLSTAVGGDGSFDAVAQRIAKLEGQLSTLAASAGTDADKGRIAGLAAITGRIADLEGKVDNQVAALRTTIPDEIDSRMEAAAEASETARATSQRTDRELQTLKTDVIRLGQRAEELKAASDRFDQTVEVLKEDVARQSSALDGIKSSLDVQLKSLARPADVSLAIEPVASRLAGLESSLQSVIKSESDRKADAERIVASLELANLKRAVESGRDYSAELAAAHTASGGNLDLSALERYKSGGLPTMPELLSQFRAIAFNIINADRVSDDAGFVDRLLSGAKSVVRVRKVDFAPDDASTEATVARIERALTEGRLGEALEQAKAIPDKAAGTASEWRTSAEARYAVDKAIAAVESQLKASLSGGTGNHDTTPPGQSN